MKLHELELRLGKEDFNSDVYSIGGSSLPSYEGLVLQRSGGKWKIEHFERGVRRELGAFDGEEEACERMYELMTEHFKW